MATRESTGQLPRPRLDAPARVLLVVAPFYRDIADALIAGARAALDAAGVAHETLEVPGALELPAAIALASRIAGGISKAPGTAITSACAPAAATAASAPAISASAMSR
jgi:hypothetical protein